MDGICALLKDEIIEIRTNKKDVYILVLHKYSIILSYENAFKQGRRLLLRRIVLALVQRKR